MKGLSLLKAASLATVIFIVALYCFAPRFYLWDPLGTSKAVSSAESNRAFYEVSQIINPLVKISNDAHKVLEWRLLFPVVANFTLMPLVVYFALPGMFTLLLLITVAHYAYQQSNSWRVAASLTLLTATSSVFFISTGYLGYFDSVLILALVWAGICRKGVTLWALASLAPWIDERFILAAPLLLWWRATQGLNWKKDFGLLALAFAPYLGLRMIALVANTDHSAGYLSIVGQCRHKGVDLFWGFIHGLRFGWLVVGAALVLAPKGTRVAGWVCIPLTILLHLLIAGDYSRSMSIAVPLMLLGGVSLARQAGRKGLYALIALGVLNLITPAYHYFRAFNYQVLPFPTQRMLSTHMREVLKDY